MNCKNFLTHGTSCEYSGIKLRWIMLSVCVAWASASYTTAQIAEWVTL